MYELSREEKEKEKSEDVGGLEERVPMESGDSKAFRVVSPVVFHMISLEFLNDSEIRLSSMMKVVMQYIIKV
jgi:hypothetical protein